jgi:hypothetical protein
MLFICTWANILRSGGGDRMNWLDKSIRSSVFDLIVSLFVLIVAWAKGNWGTLFTFLLNSVLDAVLLESSVFLVMARTDAGLLCLGRTAGIDVSLSMFLFSQIDTWLVVSGPYSNSRAGFSFHSDYVSFRLIAKLPNFFILSGSRASWMSRRDRLHGLNDSLISSIPNLPVSYFVLIGSRSESNGLRLVTFLLDGVLNRIFFKCSVLFVVSGSDTRLLSNFRTARIDMCFSLLLLGEAEIYFI